MIRIRGIRKSFPVKEGVVAALADLDLEVAAKEFFVLLGPSGSGKSTLLRCVAGIETPEAGEIHLDDRLIFSSAKGIAVRPEERGLGMVFQSYAVWPHMTVYQNVALPLTHGIKRIAKSDVPDRVMHALKLVQMEKYADRPVPLLSGGQQQRVALARALAVEPVVLLMDEPLSNLDARLREEVRVQIREVTKAVGVTVLYVTHDQTEAMALGDRIAVMDHGRILQIDTADAIYNRPVNPMVAEFFGAMNWMAGTVRDGATVDTPIGALRASADLLRGPVRIGIRPSDIELSPTPGSGPNEIGGDVVDETFLGEQILLKVRLGPEIVFDVKARRRADDRWLGNRVYCRCDPGAVMLFAG